MRPFQFTIRALLALTVLVAVGCTAMMNASPVWSLGVHTAVLIVLAVFLLRAIILGRSAVFSIGFATVGWLYAISGSPLVGYYMGMQLPTEVALVYVAGHKYQVSVDRTAGEFYLADSGTDPRPDNEVNARAFCEIGHGLITLVLAFCGGLLGLYIAGVKSRRDQRSGDPCG